ncbi:hypothetical protein C2W64_00605 [Brevibacillus laterosporus]|nr:hypothetical protein C2W64_00605 [Brevibacillus laterosporus]
MQGKVKWFNKKKGMDLLKGKAVRTFLFTIPVLTVQGSVIWSRVNKYCLIS